MDFTVGYISRLRLVAIKTELDDVSDDVIKSASVTARPRETALGLPDFQSRNTGDFFHYSRHARKFVSVVTVV